MKDTPQTTEDFRAELARRRLPLYKLAAQISVHPVRLARMLNERIPLTPSVAEKIIRALAVRDALAESERDELTR